MKKSIQKSDSPEQFPLWRESLFLSSNGFVFLAVLGETCQVCLPEIEPLALSAEYAAMANLERSHFFCASPVCWHHLTQLESPWLYCKNCSWTIWSPCISCMFCSGLGVVSRCSWVIRWFFYLPSEMCWCWMLLKIWPSGECTGPRVVLCDMAFM